jgi:predicted acetyltransferase
MNMVRRLADGDLERFVTLRQVAYPGTELEEAKLKQILATRLPHSSGLFVDGDLASVATVWPMRMHVGGKLVQMGGLAGVASAPEYRRRGLVRALLAEILVRLHEQGVGWSLEYPFDPRFYHRLGWQSVPCGVELELPSEYLLAGEPPPSAKRLPLTQIASLAPIFEAWSSRYNFTLSRTDDPRDTWKRLVSDQWLDDDAFLYCLDDAYVLFTLTHEDRRQVLTVEDYAYTSGAGRRNLLAFLGAMHGQAAVVRIHLPDDDPLALDQRTRNARPRRWPLQARLVDLGAALSAMTAAVTQSVRLAVRDELCPWNDGTFDVVVGPKGTSVERSRGVPDGRLPIQTLPLLLVGALTAESALATGIAEGHAGKLAVLAGLGAGRTPFMPLSDGF